MRTVVMKTAWRRWFLRARLRAVRAVRGHYMLGVTAVVLALAAAGGAGAFESEPPPRREQARPVATAIPAVITLPLPDVPAQTPIQPNLTMTYFIVDTVEERNTLNAMKDQMINREWLRRNAIEVVLIEQAEDEARVLTLIEQSRTNVSIAHVIVEDMRGR